MDFVFQGFQSNLPAWLYVLLFAGTTALSWWSYKDSIGIRPLSRFALIGLRSAVFFLLLFLLLNPFFKSEQVSLEKPEIMVLWDNSASASIQKGDYMGQESYRDLIENLQLMDSSDVRYSTYSLGSAVNPAPLDSLRLDESQTNLYHAIEAVKNREDEITGAILISDGIFTQGRNPVFDAANLTVPIVTVALGDTVQQQDIVIEEVVTNSTGYVNTLHPVEVNILTNGFAGEQVEVQLRKGPEILERQNLQPGEARSRHTLNFELDLREEGLQQFEVVVPAKESEWTDANNVQPFAVDVLNEKQRILSLAFEIHPDVRFVRNQLLKDENTRLIPRTWIGGDRFIEGDFTLASDTLELAVIHGYPSDGLPAPVEERISEIISSVPVVIMSTPMANLNLLSRRSGITLPVSYSNSRNYNQVQIIPDAAPTEHPIMELPDISLDLLPYVNAPIRGGTVSAGANPLFMSSFQGRDTNQPLITVEEIGNNRRMLISGYDWYRLQQSSNEQVRNYAQQLFSNIISWSATRPDNRRLKIQPSKKVFSGSEAIVLNAFLTNESGENETEGIIELTLSGDNIDDRFYSMDHMGEGRYQLTINSLPQGIYSFNATAQKGSRTIDTRQGEFTVSSTNTEFVNTSRNDNLLRQLSERTGGSFFIFNELAGFADSLDKKRMLAKEEKVTTTLFYPYQHSLWFFLVISLLTAEWMLRKYLALT